MIRSWFFTTNTLNDLIPHLLTLENLHLDAQKIDRHVQLRGFHKSHRILLRGNDDFNITLHTPAHKTVDLPLIKRVVI